MVNDIGNILIDKIKNLPFIDKYAGVVKVLTFKDTNTGQKKTFPAACNITEEECRKGDYKDLCPDNSKKSVLYLEDRGCRLIKKDAATFYWKASFDLICWLNLPALGFSDCSYSAIAIMGILSALPASPIASEGIFSRINFIPSGEASKMQNPFQKYSYDETVMQFLMKPYDFFVLNIDVEFCVDKRCLTAAALQPQIPCKK